jgi:N-sulfoglucosamine sulfohydrolase
MENHGNRTPLNLPPESGPLNSRQPMLAMIFRHFPQLMASVMLAVTVTTATAAKSISLDLRQPKTNFILIIADDMAWDDCGAYGHPSLPTPNIDRLAAEGMRFNQAFVTASSCSPSRASMITGRYPHATGAEQLHWPLPRNSTTFVNWLRRSGYWTAAAGKWHLGESTKRHFNLVMEADTRGFQLPTGGSAAEAAALRQMTATKNASGCDDWLKVLRARPDNQPFFLWLAALDPHRDYEANTIPRPTDPKDVVLPPYIPDVPAVRADYARYYDEIRRLDSFMGLILDELDEEGLGENTCIIFVSDNGRPFPRDKCTVYDSGIKSPWLVRWPGVVAPGSQTDSLVSTVDLGPTLLAAAGVRGQPKSFQGVSFLPVLKDSGKSVRDHVFAERHWHDFESYGRAVRDGRYKYIRNYYFDLPLTPPADALRSPTFRAMQSLRDQKMLAGDKLLCFTTPRPYEELYDTHADPHELRNLINDSRHLTQLRTLRTAMDEWRAETRDILPAKRTEDEFNRESGLPLPNRIRPRIPPQRAQFAY